MVSLTEHQVRLVRLRSQKLFPKAPVGSSAAEIVRSVGGLQAQELPSAALGVRARSVGLTAAGVERARVEERSVVWTWGMRGTLHLLATEDASWLLPLLGPVFAGQGRRRRSELGWEAANTAEGLRVLRKALAEKGPLPRPEVARILQSHGLPWEGQATIHLLALGALEGLLCRGPFIAGEPAYVLLSNWVRLGPPLPEKEALAELARRYLAAYAPAQPEDLAAWSGLPAGMVKQGWELIAGERVEVQVAGQPAWILKKDRDQLDGRPIAGPLVRLLPRYDTYLLGYTTRALAVDPRFARRIHPGGGILHAALLVDGLAVGVWKTRSRRGGLEATVEPFDPLPQEVLPALEAEVADLGCFYETQAVYNVEKG